MLTRLPFAAAAVLIGFAACDSIFGPDPVMVQLRTDRDSYVATYLRGEPPYEEYGFTIVAKFANFGGSTVYLDRCYPDSPHPIYAVSLVGGNDSGRSGFNGAWACVGHDRPIRVDPGEVRTDKLQIVGPNSFDGITHEPFGTLEGTMRIGYRVLTCPEDRDCPIESQWTTSNEFSVQVRSR